MSPFSLLPKVWLILKVSFSVVKGLKKWSLGSETEVFRLKQGPLTSSLSGSKKKITGQGTGEKLLSQSRRVHRELWGYGAQWSLSSSPRPRFPVDTGLCKSPGLPASASAFLFMYIRHVLPVTTSKEM